jgi:hypothetical protein
MQQVRVNTRLSFGSAQPSNVAQFSVGALTPYWLVHHSALEKGKDLAEAIRSVSDLDKGRTPMEGKVPM